jgi:hypothetical protein
MARLLPPESPATVAIVTREPKGPFIPGFTLRWTEETPRAIIGPQEALDRGSHMAHITWPSGNARIAWPQKPKLSRQI